MKKSILFASLLIAVSFGSYAQSKSRLAGEYTYETECLGVEGDGSQTLKAFGFGNSKNDAVEQAKKNAVRDVLFKGIIKGKSECNAKPLLNEANIQEKHEDYFNKFFTDGGDYLNYTSMNDMPIAIVTKGKDRKSATNGVTFGIVVIVKRSELKKKMITDNILVIP